MAMNVSCPHCGVTYQLQNEWTGKTVSCTQCQTAFTVESSAPRPIAPLASPTSTSSSSSIPKKLQQRNDEQEQLNSKAKERLEFIAKYRWVGWILIVASIGYFALIIGVQSSVLSITWPASPILFLIGIALLTFDTHRHNKETVANNEERFCRDCGHEVSEWKVVAKHVGTTNKNTVSMPRLKNKSQKACPNCGCFCFNDSVQPMVNALRVPSAVVVAALVALVVFQSRNISDYPMEFGFVSGGIAFWSSLLFVGWPIRWFLFLVWHLRTGRSFSRQFHVPTHRSVSF